MIDNQEIESLKSIVENFRGIYKQLEEYEQNLGMMQNGIMKKDPDSISELTVRIRQSIIRLDQERTREKNFIKDLEKRYGPGELDLQTLEYKTKK